MKKAYSFIQNNTKTIITALLIGVLLLSVVYVLFVRSAVMNVVMREKTEAEITRLVAHIGELEFDYIEQKNNVTIDLAYEMGYSDITDTSYVSRKSAVSVLSRNQVQ